MTIPKTPSFSTQDVVKKLIGKIEPVGETNEDNKRFENLKNMCELVDKLMYDIFQVYKDNQHSNEYSVKRSADHAKYFCSEWENK